MLNLSGDNQKCLNSCFILFPNEELNVTKKCLFTFSLFRISFIFLKYMNYALKIFKKRKHEIKYLTTILCKFSVKLSLLNY